MAAVYLDTLFRGLTFFKHDFQMQHAYVHLMSSKRVYTLKSWADFHTLLNKVPLSDFCQTVLQYPRQE